MLYVYAHVQYVYIQYMYTFLPIYICTVLYSIYVLRIGVATRMVLLGEAQSVSPASSAASRSAPSQPARPEAVAAWRAWRPIEIDEADGRL